MRESDWEGVLRAAHEAAASYLGSLPTRRVAPDTTPDEVRTVVNTRLDETGIPPAEVVARLAADLEPFVTAHASGRYYGFVIGGTHPAGYGADLLVSTWDQNAALYAPTPGVSVVEEVVAGWLVDVLDLPTESSVGFVTGGQMANFTCLAAARDHVLRAVGWDVEADGLPGAPRPNIVVKTGRHSTIVRALRYLGLGERTALEVACDDQDRYLTDELRDLLETLTGPTIICAEAGNVNTGSFDPLQEIADLADAHRHRGHPTWVHVDGAIGLLAAASPRYRALMRGAERLDSWSTDGHKLLNVPYDCGIAICRHTAPHRAAMSIRASYLIQGDGETREAMDWTPEFSRRARGVPVYAVLRSLGRQGLAELVERVARLATRFASRLHDTGEVEIVNEVTFNQVLVRWLPPDAVDADAFNDRVMAAIQTDGTAFVSGTTWRGDRLMRISVADWATDENDVDRAIEAMLRCAASVRGVAT